MIRKEDLLKQVHVEKPCSANWDEMDGDASRRFCDQCQHHVHNLSEMTSAEAEALLANRTERLCVRYVKDAAGQVITRDRRPRKFPWWGRLALAASALMTIFGFQQASGKPVTEQGDVAAPKPPSKARQILGRIALSKPLQGKPVQPVMGAAPPPPQVPTTGIVAPPHHPSKPPVKVVKKKKPVGKKVAKAKPVVKPKPKPRP